MREFHANAANGHTAVGRLFVLKTTQKIIRDDTANDQAVERKRFDNALKTADKELATLEQHASDVDDEQRRLFQAHRLMLKDPELLKPIRRKIASGVSAESALDAVSRTFLERFEQTDDVLLKTRKDDIEDVINRLLRVLEGSFHVRELPEGRHIVLAESMYPSDVFTLGKKKIAGIVLKRGSVHSHVALLADALGIPFFVGLADDYEALTTCDRLILDGKNQCIIADPDPSVESEYEQETGKMTSKTRPDVIAPVTQSGIHIRVSANISSADEAEDAAFVRADGIGLFRTEYMNMATDETPDEERQFLAYKAVLEQFPGKPVTIRTMDIGSDKHDDSREQTEENPALGMRGIRHSKRHEEMFKTQLRALLRASSHGRLNIMVPMIVSEEEIAYVKTLLETIENELAGDHPNAVFPYALGIMVETPSAALMADVFAESVDFFSIGTNDLTQYTLAADRANPAVADIYDHGHPAVARLVAMVADAAREHGIPVSICGEAAADVSLLDKFITWGIDELSVPTNRITGLKRRIHEHP
jgi:phosphotransferase system enzyme I (PtsI)